MKLPETVIIQGREIRVKQNPKTDGGWLEDELITIGTKLKSTILENFLHEVIEYILLSNLLRYRNIHNTNENGNYIFVFNHDQFENIVPQIALALKDIVKK